jgi:hypothetical protein
LNPKNPKAQDFSRWTLRELLAAAHIEVDGPKLLALVEEAHRRFDRGESPWDQKPKREMAVTQARLDQVSSG